MKKHFQTYQELNEALKLSQYREYHDIRPEDIEKKLDDLFKGLNRIYIPFDYKVTDEDINEDYNLYGFLRSEGYTITNYLEGYCEKDGRTFRIGKVLNKLNRPDLLKTFNEDPQRAIQNKNFLICISKHPYDIVGMSTNRGWTSCMDLEGEKNKSYLEHEIKEGTVIAYLIDVEDKNINHPYGRINIKPYTNEKNELAWGLSKYCYGSILDEKRKKNTLTKKFKNTISRWVNSNLNRGMFGVYNLNKKVYSESIYKISRGNKNSMEYKISLWGIDVSKLKDGVYDGEIIAPKGIKEFKGFEEELGLDIKEIKGNLYFIECESLTSVSNLPDYVGGSLDFSYCGSLTSISNLPEKIGSELFLYACVSLTSISKMPSVVNGDIYAGRCPFFGEMNEKQIRHKYNISK